MNISRKILSVVASVTTAASILCAVPVSAENIENAEIGNVGICADDCTVANATMSADEFYSAINGETVNVLFHNKDGELLSDNQVVIDLPKNVCSAMYSMCTLMNIDPVMVVAIIAHESGFDPDVGNSTNVGYMAVSLQYYSYYLTLHNNIYQIAKTAGGSTVDTDAKNPYGNICAGISILDSWRDAVGEEDMLKGYAGGYNWGSYREVNDADFRYIMGQINALL